MYQSIYHLPNDRVAVYYERSMKIMVPSKGTTMRVCDTKEALMEELTILHGESSAEYAYNDLKFDLMCNNGYQRGSTGQDVTMALYFPWLT